MFVPLWIIGSVGGVLIATILVAIVSYRSATTRWKFIFLFCDQFEVNKKLSQYARVVNSHFQAQTDELKKLKAEGGTFDYLAMVQRNSTNSISIHKREFWDRVRLAKACNFVVPKTIDEALKFPL